MSFCWYCWGCGLTWVWWCRGWFQDVATTTWGENGWSEQAMLATWRLHKVFFELVSVTALQSQEIKGLQVLSSARWPYISCCCWNDSQSALPGGPVFFNFHLKGPVGSQGSPIKGFGFTAFWLVVGVVPKWSKQILRSKRKEFPFHLKSDIIFLLEDWWTSRLSVDDPKW